MSREDILQYY